MCIMHFFFYYLNKNICNNRIKNGKMQKLQYNKDEKLQRILMFTISKQQSSYCYFCIGSY